MINSSNRSEESFLLEFINIIKPYRWSIFAISLLTFILTYISLYFKPYIYESYAIIKIKPETRGEQRLNTPDPLSSALAISGNRGVEQELAILRTFYTNNRAIDKLNLKIQYFKKERYRKVEIFENPPIEIKNITIFDETTIGKDIILYPTENGFRIKIKDNLNKKIYHYGEEVKTKKFKLIVEKESNFNIPIYFKLNGNNRNIYEKIVKKNLKISKLNDKVSLIKVSYQDKSATRANSYVNALIDVYIAQSIVDKSKKNNKILDFIEEQLASTGKKLKLSESQLEDYRVSNNVIEPSVQSTALLERLSTVEVGLSENRIEEKLIQNLITFSKQNRHLDSITPTLRELGDESTIRVIERLQDLEQKANDLSAEFTEKHPELKAVRRDIHNSRRTILLNIENLKSSISNKKKNLLALKKEYEEILKTLPTQEKRLIHLRRNYEVNSKMYSYLLEKKSENEMKKVATISDYEIIDRAYSNGKPIKPKKAMNMIIATIFGFVLAVLIAYMRNFMVARVRDIKDIKGLTNLTIYGETSLALSENYEREILTNPQSPIVKSFRNLRTNIQFNCKNQKSNIILITSSVAKEGKTTVALNLSTIFQMANYKSVLIDLDLYKPTLHKKFNIEYEGGVSSYLKGKDYLGDITFSTIYPNLDIIPAGPIAHDAPELILSKKFNTLLDKLREKYDYIFIDSAPFSVVADTLYLMQYADINLIVVRENFTEKLFISNLEDTIKEHNFKNVALFINKG